MSATQLAAWIVAACVAVALAFGALHLVSSARPGQRTRFGVCAVALGVLAFAALGMGLAVANPGTPQPPRDGRCGPGLYDNGQSMSNGPVCIPWSNGGQR